VYKDKILGRASVGLDSVTPKAFDESLDENILLISKKVLAGNYHFTRYREVLINKGRGKEPRVISIPTVRDKLALASYHLFLKESFKDVIEEPLIHTIVGDITHEVLAEQYDGFVKIDITKFYASIDHNILFKKVKRKVRKTEAIAFLKKAITTETIARSGPAKERKDIEKGVPEGLSISNILADIYLTDLKEIICSSFEVKYFRYVDDILILCDAANAKRLESFAIEVLKNKFNLIVSSQKTTSGKIRNGVPFLGYVFYNNKISVRPAAEQKLENSLEELFRTWKKEKISTPLLIWRLNLRIAGCILDRKKYGWMFYYSQLNDLRIPFHLDWLVDRLFDRFNLKKPDDVKSFVRVYHEITKNVSRSTYLINVDMYSYADKLRILSSIYGCKPSDTKNRNAVDSFFKETMFDELQRLESDIQNFS